MSNKQEEQRIIDLGYDIIRDSKRRTLYYDENTKKGYQLHEKDLKWVRFYKMRLFISIFAYFLLFLIFRNQEVVFRFFVSLIASVITYFVLSVLFEKLFFNDKVPFKINQKDFEQRYEPKVLKQKRTFELFHFAFVIVYGILAFIDLYGANSPTYIIVIATIIPIVLAVWVFTRIQTINSQLKIAQQKDGTLE